jgi:hypothetical protein
MLAFLAEHALTAALSELFPREIHSTTSMLMFAYLAVLAKLLALQALSLKADKQSIDRLADHRRLSQNAGTTSFLSNISALIQFFH